MHRRVTFVLPGPGEKPMGGYKVVYEYANRLSSRGHRVTIVHPTRLNDTSGVVENLKKYFRYFQRKADRSYLPERWFDLDKRVISLWVPSLEEDQIPDSDIIIATLWRTAEWISGYGAAKGKKYYLIQHFEDWSGPEDRVLATWSLPLHKVVISKWLAEIAENLGESYTYIPNGLDFTRFGIDIPVEDRDPRTVMMLFHDEPWKGSIDGLAALQMAKAAYPDLRVILFGVPRGSTLPEWIEYHRNPRQETLRRLYNRSSIFLAPSWAEGWPLPPAEAMMSGAALVATDIGGHHEYARHGINALLSPPKNPEALARNLISLLENPARRISLARAGHENIQQFTWKRACDSLEALFDRGGDQAREAPAPHQP